MRRLAFPECSCRWEAIPEGEGLDVMYQLVEKDRRCKWHGKPRWPKKEEGDGVAV